MNQWLNRSHPMTLQAGVILGYISAVFGLLQPQFFFILYIGIGAGAFVTANNKRWGYYLLAICSTLIAVLLTAVLVANILSFSIIGVLQSLNRMVFPTALAAAVIHTQSREYQKIWFD